MRLPTTFRAASIACSARSQGLQPLPLLLKPMLSTRFSPLPQLRKSVLFSQIGLDALNRPKGGGLNKAMKTTASSWTS